MKKMCNRVRRLGTGPVARRSSPGTDVRYALLVNQPKYIESTFLVKLSISWFPIDMINKLLIANFEKNSGTAT